MDPKSHLIPVGDLKPQIGADNFFAPGSFLVGKVSTGENCSFWFNSVVRGDVNEIKIGDRVNVQDGAVIHCTYKKASTIIGSDVSIGHNAIVHGCQVSDMVLIGMGATVMDDVKIGKGSIIAAGAVVLAGTIIPENTIWAGVPAKQVKESSDLELMKRTSQNYQKYSKWFTGEDAPDW